MSKLAKSYPGIDILKFLMAICVVSIHTLPAGWFTSPAAQSLYDFLCASAVPFFFVSSGFLLAQKIETRPVTDPDPQLTVVTASLKKFTKLYVLWMLLYSPLAVWDMIRSGRGLVKGILVYLHGFFLVGEHYNSWPLWYLLSTIYALCFLWLCGKRKTPLKRIVLASIILFFCGAAVSCLLENAHILPGALSGIFGALSGLLFPGRIVNGFLYISIGMLAYRRRFSNPMGIAFLLLHLASQLSGVELIMTACSPLSGLGLLILASNASLENKPVYGLLRKLSVVLYFLHMYVWTFYYTAVYREKTFSLDSFLATTLICIVLGLIYSSLGASRSQRQSTVRLQ